MAGRDTEIERKLAEAGVAPEVTEAALEIDAILQGLRRRMRTRELGQQAIRALDLDLDQAELDVLVAVWAPVKEFGADPGQETMVSTIAQRLGIDPSRASRLVGTLIGKGLLRRAVSQQDARRTLVELTDSGLELIRAVRSYKFLLLGEFLSGWSRDEIAAFLPLLARFSTWVEDAGATPSSRLAAEIEALRRGLHTPAD
ncbi:MarR family transcriptional regulator [Rhodosalinus halophilus]|uniref:MarR family transcriptional regulator n=1 Tax=Rhodosalinus halophilus TaxID=2259333 RepID=A0A365UC34_9RHOB|nr:MarR family transcriptional regulator [Rhodosalinus halophilus]RBI86598.1 MarR family transcriptional regulator [Rhodosalinus halophilus]